jgi:predicted CXXCH cytochrome family protein
VFRPRHNTIVRTTIAALVGGAGAFVVGLMLWARTPYARGMQEPVPQPIQFDHRHHSRDDAIDCRYCHNTAEVSPQAGLPDTELCLGCHAQIWNNSPLLEPLRASHREGRPIKWRRVHKVGEFAYFNHAIHLAKGVGCVTCHGRVDEMPAVQQVVPLTMGWCLECHRDPAPRLRPLEEIASMTWQPPQGGDDDDPGRLLRELGVHTRTSCSTCHR